MTRGIRRIYRIDGPNNVDKMHYDASWCMIRSFNPRVAGLNPGDSVAFMKRKYFRLYSNLSLTQILASHLLSITPAI